MEEENGQKEGRQEEKESKGGEGEAKSGEWGIEKRWSKRGRIKKIAGMEARKRKRAGEGRGK